MSLGTTRIARRLAKYFETPGECTETSVPTLLYLHFHQEMFRNRAHEERQQIRDELCKNIVLCDIALALDWTTPGPGCNSNKKIQHC